MENLGCTFFYSSLPSRPYLWLSPTSLWNNILVVSELTTPVSHLLFFAKFEGFKEFHLTDENWEEATKGKLYFVSKCEDVLDDVSYSDFF